MTGDLISIKQLPVIEERLQSISEEIQAQTAEVLALAVTEDTVKEIKKRRTELNKSFKDLEDKRKAVKSAVMAPYDAFEEVYKKYVTNIFQPADVKLKTRINEVEKSLLDAKKAEVVAHFEDSAAARNIDFVTFDRLGIKIILSDSMKKLKEQVEDALEGIYGDLAVIATMEHPEEILVEYKDNLNLASSVLTVKKRKERLAAELQRQEEVRAADSAPSAAPAAETPVKEPEPEPDPEPEPEPVPTTKSILPGPPPSAPAKITVTIIADSYDEVMAITSVCKDRGIKYYLS